MGGLMDGKVCMITGATAGIGRATALGLATMGATVVAVGRDPERGAEAVADIKRRSANDAVTFLRADLSSQQEVRDLAHAFVAAHDRLHVLVNNAGAVFGRRAVSVDGIEMTFALDHLGYFLLTNLLLPTLERSAPARVVSVSSRVHRTGHIAFDNLQGEQGYRSFRAYGQAKLANVLFTYELAQRLRGTGVTATCAAPGLVASNFGTGNTGLVGIFSRLTHVVAISPAQGAATPIYLASSPLVEGVTGKYFYKMEDTRSSKESYDATIARRLWEVSARMTGLVPATA